MRKSYSVGVLQYGKVSALSHIVILVANVSDGGTAKGMFRQHNLNPSISCRGVLLLKAPAPFFPLLLLICSA